MQFVTLLGSSHVKHFVCEPDFLFSSAKLVKTSALLAYSASEQKEQKGIKTD
jgi:hypothetical protein